MARPPGSSLYFMDITLHPEVEALLKEIHTGDISELVNNLALVFAKGGFIRQADIAARFSVKKVFRKKSLELVPAFEEITNEFQGFAIVGESVSETLWIQNPELHDAIENNTIILVMKSPRTRGISLKKGPSIEASPQIKSDLS